MCSRGAFSLLWSKGWSSHENPSKWLLRPAAIWYQLRTLHDIDPSTQARITVTSTMRFIGFVTLLVICVVVVSVQAAPLALRSPSTIPLRIARSDAPATLEEFVSGAFTFFNPSKTASAASGAPQYNSFLDMIRGKSVYVSLSVLPYRSGIS